MQLQSQDFMQPPYLSSDTEDQDLLSRPGSQGFAVFGLLYARTRTINYPDHSSYFVILTGSLD